MNKTKYKTVIELVRQRVLNGDYMFTDSPSERSLARETGVSYMTARRAVQDLIREKVLVRMKNGRLQPNSRYSNGHRCRQVALITPPSSNSTSLQQWYNAIRESVEGHGGILRVVTYDHNDDPVIYDALDGNFDVVFLNSLTPSTTLKLRLSRVQKKVVSLFRDMSDIGILSIDGISPNYIGELVGKLVKLGHRKMAFFNTHAESTVITLRLNGWKKEMASRNLPEIIIDEPVQAFHNPCAKSYETFLRLAKQGPLPFTALFTTTVYSARGVLRAMHDCGMKCPADISIFSLGELSEARFCIPSITTIGNANLDAYIDDIYLQVLEGKIDRSKVHYCPEPEYFIGESICKAKT